ncbi:helix-turn-helix domain-containing protein [Streptomyces sp. IMTB 2501]|uniref:helix-turn-helix domain-containing protein n=1 Tax=Streptomyces sp. IMTB 2501 TaxID=1776340 RepID=UPI00096D73A5|nr:helix-turn-helix domain-containing protein [Streptomyces sp. IMTB 2501]OLZ60806.1 helix-turn-helix domain-containing protein [Streptomyces sp. IMTB 2501]
MAEKKPNAALRPIQGVRRSTTHSGVTHVRTYQSGQYVVVGNHLAQHRELSLTAIGLATHILSVPEGTPVDIRSLADRFPEGRERIASALRELEAHGYLARVREHTESGRLVTRTYVHHTPANGSPAPLRVAGRPATTRTHGRRPVAGAEVTETPKEDDQSPHRDTPEPEPEAGSKERGPRDRHHDRAVALLAGLRRTDERLALSQRQVDRLAPAVAAWFEVGATDIAVHSALSADLPEDMRHPAGVLAYRLDAMLPVPLPARPAPSPATGVATGPVRRSEPLQNCDGCDRAFRSPRPGRCRDCRADRAVPSEGACVA